MMSRAEAYRHNQHRKDAGCVGFWNDWLRCIFAPQYVR
jgi:hypothetical protein